MIFYAAIDGRGSAEFDDLGVLTGSTPVLGDFSVYSFPGSENQHPSVPNPFNGVDISQENRVSLKELPNDVWNVRETYKNALITSAQRSQAKTVPHLLYLEDKSAESSNVHIYQHMIEGDFIVSFN